MKWKKIKIIADAKRMADGMIDEVNNFKYLKASEFAAITIQEAERAIAEKSFNYKQKKLWERIIRDYMGKGCKLYPYANGLLCRIKTDAITKRDFEWMQNSLIPIFLDDQTLYLSKLKFPKSKNEEAI